MKKLFTIILFIGVLQLHAQVGDSLLANERSIDRPLNVHNGQFRGTAGYLLGITSVRFDDNANSINLSEEGFTNISHSLYFELKYGFFEFLQLSAFVQHVQSAQRARNEVVIAPPSSVDINQITETVGWSDFTLALDLNLPVFEGADAAVSFGRSFGANAQPDQPSHTITENDPFNEVVFRFSENPGSGVSGWVAGAAFKWRYQDIAFSGLYNRVFPSGEGESINWFQQLQNGEIAYRQENYNYLLGDRYQLQALFEYQAFPFFVTQMGYVLDGNTRGWSEETGQRLLVPAQRLHRLLAGFEVIVTPRLWVRQNIQLPLAGQNRLGPLTFSTFLSYNLFPFEK